MDSIKRPRIRPWPMMSIAVIGLSGAVGFRAYKKATMYNGTENYQIEYPKSFANWKSLPHTPQTLFLFQDPTKMFLLRGAVSQVISEVNPTPELDTDGLANYYIDRTNENMTGWTAEKLGDIRGQRDQRFSVIERKGSGKTVLTAFSARGNTTLMVTVSAHKQSSEAVDEALLDLKNYVSQIGLVLTDMGGGREAAAPAG